MLSRLFVSLSLGLMGVVAATVPAFAAADSPNESSLIIGTALLVSGLMVLLLVISMIKHAAGLDKMPPDAQPEPAEPHH